MEDLERIHAKEEIKKWKRSLTTKQLEEYKKKHKLSKEVGHRIQRITKRIDKAIEDQNKVSVEGERKFLQQAYFVAYVQRGKEVEHWLPTLSLKRSYHLVYVIPIIDLYNTYIEKIENFQTKPPSPPSSPTILLTMDAITRCENSLSPEAKALLNTKKLERRSIRGRITKTVNKMTDDINNRDKFAIEDSKAILLDARKNLDKKDEEIWASYDDEAMAADVNQGEVWAKKISEAIANANRFLDSLAPAISPLTPAPAPAAPTAHYARLPKIDLPKFSGKTPAEYQTWWNSFESLIDKRPDLAKVDKLQYLKNCCIVPLIKPKNWQKDTV